MNNRQRGANLIETVVYVAIFAVMSVFMVNSMIVSASLFGELRALRATTNGASDALERMTREIRLARSVDVAQSNLGDHPGQLVMNSRNEEGQEHTVDIFVASSSLMIEEEGVTSQLLPEQVMIDSLLFYRMATSSRETISIQMTVYDQRQDPPKFKTFYATAAVRGAY